MTIRGAPPEAGPKWATRMRRSSWTLVLVVSMTRVARARSGARRSRSTRTPSSTASAPSRPARGRERVRASRLAEAMEEGLVARVEEEHVQVPLAARFEQLQHVADLAEEGPDANVDPQRQARHLPALAERDGLRREERRQVVDAEEARGPRARAGPATCPRPTGR